MKIIVNKSVYVQKQDIRYLKSLNNLTSLTIYLKYKYLLTEKLDEYEFVKVKNIEDKKYIKNLNSILDFNELNKLSINELIDVAQDLLSKKYELSKKYNCLPTSEKEKNIDLVYYCTELTHMFYSIKDMVLYKRGDILFDIPQVKKKAK